MAVKDMRYRNYETMRDPRLSRKYFKERVEMEIENIGSYYDVEKGSFTYYQMEKAYNTDATCIHFDNITESHKWVLKEENVGYNIYRCSKCGALRQIVKR